MYLTHKCCDLVANEFVMLADDGVTIEDREACEGLLVELYFPESCYRKYVDYWNLKTVFRLNVNYDDQDCGARRGWDGNGLFGFIGSSTKNTCFIVDIA